MQRLIRTVDWTISRIAEDVGYLSVNTFCRAFTPQYRLQRFHVQDHIRASKLTNGKERPYAITLVPETRRELE